MISYAANGRISGVWMVRRMLSEKLIYASDADLQFRNGRHYLSGLQFSEDLRSDHEIMSDFRTIARNVLYLFYFAEEQRYLRVPAQKIAPEYRKERPTEPLTGIPLLMRFSTGEFRAFFDEDETVLYASPEFLTSVPNAAELLRDLVRTIYLYAGESGPQRILIRERREISTEMLASDLSISYLPSELAEETGLPDERDARLEENVASTLSRLQKMMQDIDDQSMDVESDFSRYELSFESGERFENDYYSIAVPDGFRTEKDLDGNDYVMWLPNPENPDEWEASLFSVRQKAGSGLSSDTLEESREGSILRFETGVPKAEGLGLHIRMVGVTEETAEDAREAVKRLLSTLSEKS